MLPEIFIIMIPFVLMVPMSLCPMIAFIMMRCRGISESYAGSVAIGGAVIIGVLYMVYYDEMLMFIRGALS